MCADKVKNIVALSSDTSAPLIADLQYFELYSTEALNRKMKNIVLPGVYCGFEPVPGDGLFVRITSEKTEGRGAASVDVGKCQISVQQVSDVVVPVEAGVTTIIVLEANYEHGVKTSQVDSSSDISAARIIALVDEDIASNQIELCRVIVPDNAQAVTSDMISTKYRANRAVGVEFSSALDSDEEYKAATPLAISTLNKLKAPVDSPEFIGIPKSPTPEQGTNSTQIANAAFVQAAITALIDGSPSALDTLKKIADAINNDPQFSQTINGALALKAPLLSPAFTGVPTAPTASQGTNNTQIANTAFVKAAITALINGAPSTLDTLKEIAAAINNDPNFSTTINNALALKAPLASPALTGVPTAPTAAQGTNNTQIATTAYVRAAISALVGSSPEALDTLNELAAALGNDPNFATTMTNALAGKQPLDATLTALAGLATAANKLPYFTGKDTVALADLTSVGRNILAKTSVLAVIQYLGLRELGTSGEKIPLLSTANTWSERQTFNGGITGSLTGNADTATKLKTARKINNVSFDGSSDITLTASDVEALPLEDARKIIQPLPDVWIPFNDSLDMIAGFSPSYKKIVIGDDEITMPGDKVVKFKRASKATYINKSGVLTEAAIDEPRFERDGLLIEGQRTNYMLNSENPASWGRSSNMDVPETGTDSFGFTYGKFVCNDSLIGQTSAINMASIAATKSVDVSGDNKYVTTSCRFKTELQVRLRIRFDKYDGSATTFLGDAYIDTQTLEITMTGGAASRITARVRKDEATGWIFAEATIQAIDGELKIGSQIQYSPKQGGATVSGDYIYLATPQVENGPCVSSFIISGTTAATRASDIVTVPIKNNLYNLPFTVLCEVHKNWYKTPNAAPRVFDTGGHQTGAAIILGFGSSADYDGFPYCDIGGANRRVNENASLEKMVMGMRVKSDQSTCSVSNGRISSETKTTWSYIQNSATIRIGGQTTAGLRHLFGHVRNFRIWHKALTDQQMGEVI
ncbi:phage tail protein (plasmid) [Escherichia marmotae]|nr:phage tail protein [Escherichia marmotae]WFV29563.1 phage tail protein [Escherichia marmotae]HAI0478413.1 phage tail protein [Escherichia coli]